MEISKLWLIVAMLAVIFIHFVILITWTQYHEADMEAQWSDGYRAYQADTYLPKPNHKAPLQGLKEKVLDGR
jgi:protein-S-isoprenylcysteine O-methyltransferase Ste14